IIPIIVMSWFYDLKGGIITGLLSHFYIIGIYLLFLNTQLSFFLNTLNRVIMIIEFILGITVGFMSYIGKKLDLEIKQRKKAEDKLNFYANMDSLTTTFNRRSGLGFLQKQIDLTKSNSSYTFTIAYLDVNFLKTVNDNYGHNEGDLLILNLVKIIKSTIDPCDMLIRLGGDEFLIIMTKKDFISASNLINSTKVLIDNYNSKKLKPYKLSASFGIAHYKNSMTMDELLKEADIQMYKEKSKFHKNQS
ncbi:MAG: GGDEF domain-containing protein, partial [Clostridiaceae bacterium]